MAEFLKVLINGLLFSLVGIMNTEPLISMAIFTPMMLMCPRLINIITTSL